MQLLRLIHGDGFGWHPAFGPKRRTTMRSLPAPPGERWLKPREAARILGITTDTLTRWANATKIDCRRGPANVREYHEPAVRALAAELEAKAPR